jgi:hypothetical protein
MHFSTSETRDFSAHMSDLPDPQDLPKTKPGADD